jgi:D-glycero-D-manno-heptose 1,7-bisphosphate phosphatase
MNRRPKEPVGQRAEESKRNPKGAARGRTMTATSPGKPSKAASSGNGSKPADSGKPSKAASSGKGSKPAGSGKPSKSASSGSGSVKAAPARKGGAARGARKPGSRASESSADGSARDGALGHSQAQRPPFTVFLDRDGVFNVNPCPAVFRPKGFRWLPGALESFARLNRAGVRTCLATNQPFLGTFTFGLALRRVNEGLRHAVEAQGGRLDRIEASLAPPFIGFLAPLLPRRLRHALRRRKPGPGMLEDGGRALGTDKARAVMVGDKVKDAQAAQRYGVPAILLSTTHDYSYLESRCKARGVPVLAIVPGLPEAVERILGLVDA